MIHQQVRYCLVIFLMFISTPGVFVIMKLPGVDKVLSLIHISKAYTDMVIPVQRVMKIIIIYNVISARFQSNKRCV